MWREGGQFSTEKYIIKKKIEKLIFIKLIEFFFQ